MRAFRRSMQGSWGGRHRLAHVVRSSPRWTARRGLKSGRRGRRLCAYARVIAGRSRNRNSGGAIFVSSSARGEPAQQLGVLLSAKSGPVPGIGDPPRSLSALPAHQPKDCQTHPAGEVGQAGSMRESWESRHAETRATPLHTFRRIVARESTPYLSGSSNRASAYGWLS